MKTTLNSNVNPQQQANVPALPSQKPPILKPKPKSTNIYATPHSNNNNNNNSAHNRSTEPLLNSTINQTAANVAAILSSFNTSPSTSITDVSSNNCTPQHNLNGIEEAATAASLPLSCNIVKHTTFGNGAITTKVTTTTTTTNTPLANASSGAGGYYESVNLLNGTMGRGHKNGMNGVSIDEEIMAVKSNNNTNNSSFMSRTLERRHVKNSEC